MTDPHILRVLEQVQALGYDEPRHFAILQDPGQNVRGIHSRMLENRYGVSAIYYKDAGTRSKNPHACFPKFIAALNVEWKKTCQNISSVQLKELKSKANEPLAPFPEMKLTGKKDEDDPNRGRFGKEFARDGVILKASVTPDPDDDDWFHIKLTVEEDTRFSSKKPLKNGTQVKFHLHPTFPKDTVSRIVRGGMAKLNCYAYGAFTVGVEVSGRTCLELDLSQLENTPATFRGR
jgi:hypothetical protein